MRQRRTIYFNDARHYYLFVHEPPMRIQDAWAAVDEVADTGVDTFIYGVARDDGWFYPSKVGLPFGQDMQDDFQQNAYWRLWHNMQSLIERGLDPLQVLVDRAHERGMDFLASLRMGAYAGMAKELSPSEGGPGMAHEDVRQFMLRGVTELATRYDTDGVELDFAAAPGGTSNWFPPQEAAGLGPVMTEWMRRASDAIRSRDGKAPGVVGARIYPTLEVNRKTGLEVERWLEEGLVDYVVPMVYAHMILDQAMPIEWLVEAAQARDVSVYYMLHPYYADESRGLNARQFPSPAMFRAAAANAWQLGVDGLYTWFMSWPLGETERAILGQLSDPKQIAEGDKHYFLRRRSDSDHIKDVDYPSHLPVSIDPATDLGRTFEIPVTIADDVAGNDRIGSVVLRLALSDLVSADRLEVRINGERLSLEGARRRPTKMVAPYAGMWLEVELDRSTLRKGTNRLEVALLERPADLRSKVGIEDVEVVVEYELWNRVQKE